MKPIKIVNIVFTALNVLVLAAVFVMIGYGYFHPGLSTGPLIGFHLAVLFIPVFIIVNAIWMGIRNNLIQKPLHALEYIDSNRRIKFCLDRLNRIFIFLNILLFGVILIRIIIESVRYGSADWINKLFFEHSVFFELINVAWIIFYVNTKDRLEEKYRKQEK